MDNTGGYYSQLWVVTDAILRVDDEEDDSVANEGTSCYAAAAATDT